MLEVDPYSRLSGFQEKPVIDFDVSMGIYCIKRSVIAALTPGQKYGFDDLMRDRLNQKQNVDIRPFTGYWLDIGRPDDYEYADENFVQLSIKLGLGE